MGEDGLADQRRGSGMGGDGSAKLSLRRWQISRLSETSLRSAACTRRLCKRPCKRTVSVRTVVGDVRAPPLAPSAAATDQVLVPEGIAVPGADEVVGVEVVMGRNVVSWSGLGLACGGSDIRHTKIVTL